MSDLAATLESLPQLDIEDLFTVDVVAYEEVHSASVLRNTPRYGYPSNFSALASSDDRWDYVRGLSITTIILLSIFLAWSILLLLFKCLGSKRVGFLSGSGFVKPQNRSGSYLRPCISRMIFLFSGAAFIVFSVLFNTKGMQYVFNTIDTADGSMLDASNYAARFVNIFIDVAGVSSNSISLAGDLNDLLDDSEGMKCLEDTGKVQSGFEQTVLGYLSELGNFVPEDYDQLKQRSEKLKDYAETINEQVPLADDAKVYGLIFTIFYITTPIIMLGGVLAAWFKVDMLWLRCVLSWLILPIFYLQAVLVSILTSLNIFATANADFCSGGQTQSPDDTIVELLIAVGFEPSKLTFKTAEFYIRQCTAEFPYQEVSDYFDQLVEAVPSIKNLDDSLIDVTGGIFSRKLAQQPSQCLDYAKELAAVTDGVLANVLTLANSVVEVFHLLKCETIVPLYTNLVYDGACDQSVKAFTWLVLSFIVMSATGFTMITLRSSWQLDVNDDDDVFDVNEKNIPPKTSPNPYSREQEPQDLIYARAEEPMKYNTGAYSRAKARAEESLKHNANATPRK